MGDIAVHQNAHQTYIEEGVRLFALADRATVMFAEQPPAEKRKLLDCVGRTARGKWRAEPFGDDGGGPVRGP